ncbi:MAG: membrane protein insertase YidC [bacterium]
MEKRLILAIFISAVILFFFNYYFSPPPQQETGKTGVEATSEEMAPTPAASPTPPAPPTSKVLEKEIEIPEKARFIQTDLLSIELTPRGEVKSWQPNQYQEEGDKLVDLVPPYPEEDFPLGVRLGGRELIPNEFYLHDHQVREFIYQLDEFPGVRFSKRLSFKPGTYVVDLELEATNRSLKEVKIAGLSLEGGRVYIPTREKEGHSWGGLNQAYYSGGKMVKVDYGGGGFLEGILTAIGLLEPMPHQDEVKDIKVPVSWITQGSRYFLTVIIPESPGPGAEATFKLDREGNFSMMTTIPPILIPPQGKQSFKFRIYGGPREHDRLISLAEGTGELLDLWSLALLMLKILNFFHQISGNYGIAIILLTVAIKIILYPLNQRSFKSMKAMQELQPQLNQLKEKHKKNREALNIEMMALYKRHKVNPIGGCLPLLLQMPIFIALYSTLSKAIELRGAEFILWVRDLSAKDPYYVLPILMGISMLIQQRMTPAGDPTQARMMMFMPIIFTFMFLSFPSGLVLYWLVQNILTIGQQYLINRSVGKN